MTIEEKLTDEINAAIEETIQGDEETGSVDSQEEEKTEGQKEEKAEGQEEIKSEAEETVTEEAEEEGEEKTEQEMPEQEYKFTPVSISNETLTRAIRAGLGLAEAQAFPSEQSLVMVCENLEEAQQAAFEAVETTGKEKEEDPLAAFDKLDPEEFEPEVIKLLTTMANAVRAQRDEVQAQRERLQELQAGQEYATQANQEVAAREVKDWFDKQVEGLGADFHDSLGGGVYDALPKGSSQLAKRDAIADEIRLALAGYQAMGAQPPSREALFQRAAKIVLSDEYARIEQGKLKKKLSARSKQHMQRAGGRGTKTESGSPEDEIAEELNEKFGLRR